MHGYVQVYTGEGRGKTTAALGLALRAVAAGLRVLVVQLAKGMAHSELAALDRPNDAIEVRQCGRDCFIRNQPTDQDRRLAREGFAAARQDVRSARAARFGDDGCINQSRLRKGNRPGQCMADCGYTRGP